MKRNLLIGSAVSALFLVLAFRNVEWRTLGEVLRNTRFAFLVPAVLFSMLGHVIRAYRWRIILLPLKATRLANLFFATIVGFMANNLLPARMGELVRAYVIGRRENISRSASFATIVYERVVDVFSLLALLWISLLNVSGPQWLRLGGLWILGLNIALLLVLFVMERRQQSVRRIAAIAGRLFPQRLREKIEHASAAFLDGLAVVRKTSALVPIALTSVLVWFLAILGIYFCFGALDMHLSPAAGVTLIVLVSLGSMIPSAPAYIGTTQYACVLGLALFGVERSEALAYSLLYHASQFFPITILGLAFVWKANIRLGEISVKRYPER